jgi:hypothetical protein
VTFKSNVREWHAAVTSLANPESDITQATCSCSSLTSKHPNLERECCRLWQSEGVCLARLQAVQQLGCPICCPTAVCHLVVIRDTRLQTCNMQHTPQNLVSHDASHDKSDIVCLICMAECLAAATDTHVL